MKHHAATNNLDDHAAYDGAEVVRFGGGAERYHLSIGKQASEELGGSGKADHAWGGMGDDSLGGGEGNDALRGGAGADLLSAGAGQDMLRGGEGGDTMFGAAEDDMLHGEEGADLLDEGMGHGGLEGGPGADTLIGGAGPDAFVVDRESGDDVIVDFTAGPGVFDHLALRDLRWEDLAFADDGDGVRISWQGGSVQLIGVGMEDLAQDDFMFAESPDLPPAMRQSDGAAPERETPSTDGPEITAGKGRANRPDPAGQELAVDDGSAIIGGNARDTLVGGEGEDHLFGRGGRDLLLGGAGNDVLQGDNGRDTLIGEGGMDRLDGGRGDDLLIGGAMADELKGGDGDDILDEGAGHGMIEGGRGDDLITGGTGADAFMVAPDSGNDVVTDFEATGDAQGAFDHIAFRDIVASQVSVTDTDAGVLVAWDTDGSDAPDGSVLLLGLAVSDLRQSDFMFEAEPAFVPGISAEGSWYVFA